MERCKRFIIFLVFLLLFALPSIAGAAPIYDRLQRLDVIETEHFKIYYPPADLDYARRTEFNCEKALSEINERLGTSWSPKGFPVVITDDIHMLNAYYTPVTSDHVILYNTLPNEGELNYFSDLEYSIVLHELTHALTLSIKSPAFDFFSVIVGDAFNNMIFMNYGIIEGYAVMMESLGGEGRANDAFAMNSILQGMRNREILNYRRSSGALKRYPAVKSAYVFTGAFLKYVYDRFGKEKMIEFTRGLPSGISIPGLFASIYGESIDSACGEFIESFAFPETAPSDRIINEGSIYSNLRANGDSLYFLDESAGRVYRYDSSGICNMLSTRSPMKFAFSNAGNLFAILEYERDNPVLKLYDAFRGRIRYSDRISNVYDFAFARCNGKDCLALYKFDGRSKSIDFVDVNTGVLLGQHFVGGGESIYSLTQCDDGKIAFLSNRRNKSSICMYDIEKRSLCEFDDEMDVVKRMLSYDAKHGRLVFAYAEHGIDPASLHYPRLGVLLRGDDGTYSYRLCREDLEGGVSYPQIVDSKLAYVSEGYREDEIRYADLKSLSFVEYKSNPIMMELSSSDGSSDAWNTIGRNYLEARPESSVVPYRYNPLLKSFPFTSGGLLVPILGNDGGSFAAGLQMLTSEPTGQFSSYIIAEYMFPLSGGTKNHISLNYTHALSTRDLTLSLSLKPYLKFDRSATLEFVHFDLTTVFSFIWTKHFGSDNYLEISGNASYDLPLYESGVYLKDGLGFNFNVKYADLVQRGYGFKNVKGLATSFRLNVSDTNAHFKHSGFLFFPTLEFGIGYAFPQIIPVQNTRMLTYSLPLSVSFLARYKYSPYQRNALTSDSNLELRLSANLVLFSVDLSETFIDVPFVVNAISFEFSPSVKYLNYVNRPLTDNRVFNGLKFDFSFLAYVRLTPTFLGVYFTSNYLDIGIRYSVGQDEISGRFKGRPYLYFGLNGSAIFGGDSSFDSF